jgi:short-subunit dehydrogenase
MLAGKIVWITGASSGIGEELAYQLSRRGAKLILSARRESELERVRKACASPDLHRILTLDLADVDGMPETVTKALALFGKVDILVNNGGVSQRGLVMDIPIDVDRRLFEVDFFGTIALTKALLPAMVESHSGYIVNIASVAGKVGPPFRSTYAAAKHALLGYMDALRCEVNQYGISVTNICPGFIKTNASINALSADGTPFGRTDEDISGGMPVQKCVAKIVAAMESKKREVIVAEGIALVSYHFKRLFPNTFLKVFQREADRRIREF